MKHPNKEIMERLIDRMCGDCQKSVDQLKAIQQVLENSKRSV